MIHYFGTQITPLLIFRFEPRYNVCGDVDLCVSIEWRELDSFAQYHGYGAWEGQSDLIAKIDSIIRDRLPFHVEGSVYDSPVDEVGEHWMLPLPAHKQITADYIDVV